MLQAVAIVAAWNWDACTEETSMVEEAESLRRDIDTHHMPRSVTWC